MTKEQLLKQIYDISYLEGRFTLRSGVVSTEYFDKYQFESAPTLLKTITALLEPLVPKDTQVLAGLEVGGIPIATALSLSLNLPVVFVRKQAKTYGTRKAIEGCLVKNRRVCIIEDVVTTGGQVVTSAKDLMIEGAKILSVLCVINRSIEVTKIEEQGFLIKSLFNIKDFELLKKS